MADEVSGSRFAWLGGVAEPLKHTPAVNWSTIGAGILLAIVIRVSVSIAWRGLVGFGLLQKRAHIKCKPALAYPAWMKLSKSSGIDLRSG